MLLSCFLSSDCCTAWRSTQTSSAICGKRAPQYPCRQSLGEGLSSLFFFFFSVKPSVKSLLTLELFRTKEVWAGTEILGVVERWSLWLTLHCHRQNDPALRRGTVSPLCAVILIVGGQSY